MRTIKFEYIDIDGLNPREVIKRIVKVLAHMPNNEKLTYIDNVPLAGRDQITLWIEQDHATAPISQADAPTPTTYTSTPATPVCNCGNAAIKSQFHTKYCDITKAGL